MTMIAKISDVLVGMGVTLRVTPDTGFDFFDSLGFMAFIVEIEEAFEVTIPNSEIDRIKTVGDLILRIKEYTVRVHTP